MLCRNVKLCHCNYSYTIRASLRAKPLFFLVAGGPGFDSGLTESESAVLLALTSIETSAISQRALIVDVAVQLFIENGYAATSVRQIAEHVGCSEAAKCYHFKDGKYELFQAVPKKTYRI